MACWSEDALKLIDLVFKVHYDMFKNVFELNIIIIDLPFFKNYNFYITLNQNSVYKLHSMSALFNIYSQTSRMKVIYI